MSLKESPQLDDLLQEIIDLVHKYKKIDVPNVNTVVDIESLIKTDESFLRLAYWVIFEREIDATGLAGWSSELKSGLSKSALIHKLYESPEFQNRVIAESGWAEINQKLHQAKLGLVQTLPSPAEVIKNIGSYSSYNIVGESTDNNEPTLTNPISQLCTEAQFYEMAYQFWCGVMSDKACLHRKQWEFCYILQVLATRGMLAPGRKGLGFGVGQEPIPSVLASYGCSVVATDLGEEEAALKGWVTTGQHALCLERLNQRHICPDHIFQALVEYKPGVNMNAIPSEFSDFDFVWSSCALEHLGSLRAGLDFIKNSLSCVKSGGIVVHTTEFNISSNEETVDNHHTVLFRRSDIESLIKELQQDHHKIVVNYHPGYGQLDQYVDIPPYKAEAHLKLLISNYVVTSIGLVIQKH
jgi:2-polyprenyl-3-methyl-5-hydroxy-6-metoxy-1,4-benzoquinol methylase